MAQPSINITFTELGTSAIRRGERGIVAMVLKGEEAGTFDVRTEADIPNTMSAENAKQIKLALLGYVNPPRRVIGYIMPAMAYTYTAVTPSTGDNPSTEGWYTKSGDVYTLSLDTIAKSGITYYEQSIDYSEVTPEEGDNPAENGWYEKEGNDYFPSEDTEVDGEKTYYAQAITYSAATVEYADNPATRGWYELSSGTYSATADTYPLTGKEYFTKSSEQSENTDYTAAYSYLSTVRYNYLVIPSVASDNKVSEVVSFVKAQREDHNLIKAILPNAAANNEGIINVTTSEFIDDTSTYTTEEYCARVAGIIAGTPLTMSATYSPLQELTDCTRLSRSDADAAEEAGEFIAMWDGEKVKMGRAVNSLTTVTKTKGAQFKKIKIVDAMDMIYSDIRTTIEDDYIGKYPNTFANKCLLISAINNYFASLVKDQVLAAYNVDIDMEANRAYLAGRGFDVDTMRDSEIRTANTGSNVYLTATLSMVDAIEDITLAITI